METEALSGLERFAQTFLNWEVLVKYAPSILAGVGVTVWLSVLIILVGMTLGTLLACLRAYRVGPLSFLIVVFADVFRALPPLVVILLVFFGLPNAGIYLSAFMVLFVVLTLILAAFAEEILWAGITSVDKGQWEAARSTGLGLCDLAAGDAPCDPAAHQPRHRHHQDDCPRHSDRGARHPQSGDHGPELFRQRLAAPAGGAGLCAALLALRDPVALARTALLVEKGVIRWTS